MYVAAKDPNFLFENAKNDNIKIIIIIIIIIITTTTKIILLLFTNTRTTELRIVYNHKTLVREKLKSMIKFM